MSPFTLLCELCNTTELFAKLVSSRHAHRARATTNVHTTDDDVVVSVILPGVPRDMISIEPRTGFARIDDRT